VDPLAKSSQDAKSEDGFVLVSMQKGHETDIEILDSTLMMMIMVVKGKSK